MFSRSGAAVTWLASAAMGLMFGAGLLVSGMSNPAKVLGFLDVAGMWDPSLALVMAGAIAVGLVGFRFAGRRVGSLLGTPMKLPPPRAADPQVVGGSFVFGIGWGLVGFCPGPALVALGAGSFDAWVFVGAMLAGMAAFEGIEWLRARGAKA